MWIRGKKTVEKTDAQLLSLYKAKHDINVLGILYERYLEYVYGVCLQYMPDVENSKDAVMQIFQLLEKKLKTHQVDRFKSWLHVVTKNYCLEWLRKNKKIKINHYEPQFMHSLAVVHHDKALEIIPENKELYDCIKKLPNKQKACIELFYLNGHSYQEIAEKLQVKKDIVRSYIQNGRRNLRQCLEKKNGKG